MEEEKSPVKDDPVVEENYTSEQWTEKGIEQLKLTDFSIALSNFNNAIALDPDNVIALLHKGIALDKLEYHQTAINTFKKVIERQKPSDIVNQAKLYLDQAIENQKQWKIRTTKKKIKGLSDGTIFGCVGCLALIAAILNVVFFVISMNDGFINYGLIISTVIFVFFWCAWVNVKNKFESSSKIMMEMYNELKKKPEDEKRED